ncbi:MAG: hypothetical protein M3280_07865 [Actinomycetota bacterium]|nr:hypothetical protein [Actinomycetota bacterium]
MRRLRLRGEAGVAMITVMLVGATLTVLASAAALTTISELRSGTDDRKAAEALSFAEAGIDRLLRYIRTGNNITWGKLIQAGCENPGGLKVPTGSLGVGSFEATLKVYEPNPPSGNSVDRFVPGACNYRATAPNDPQGQSFVITSKGSQPAAKRVVQQIVQIKPLGLPVGIYANVIDAGGSPNMVGVSMFSETQIRGREKLAFSGTDPYYFMQDVFPEGVVGRSPLEHAPAAGHAALGIFMKQNGTKPEFPGPAPETTKNCAANNGGVVSQSLWDSDGSTATGSLTSGCSGQSGYPTTSKFTTTTLDSIRPHVLDEQDHVALRDAAKEGGLYCSINGGSGTCTLMGNTVAYQSVWGDTHIAELFNSGIYNFVAYFEFLSGDTLTNQVKWHSNVWGCNADPNLTKSAVVVVRRGGIELQDASLNGAIIIDGDMKYTGNPVMNGTVISRGGFRISGNATFSLDDCWVQNMPGPFLTAVPNSWNEIDR